MDRKKLEITHVSPEISGPLTDFFQSLIESEDHLSFHPHPLNHEESVKRSKYRGADLYYVMVEGDVVLAYGMLRGWDEGFEVPSLGIAVHPKDRGTGLGKSMMVFIHAAARRRGSTHIQLKVYPNNTTAITLYKELGYAFDSEENGQLVGILRIK